MGRPNGDQSDQNSTYSHFSHPHPLQVLNTQVLPTNLNCFACKLEASGSVYSCISCNFFLHPKCYNLPQKIKHEFDENHVLSLQPKPVYPEGLFNCDACGHTGDGFSYHCSPCKTDLHALCACLPMSFTHHCHHHPLSLTFSAPYPGNAFSCDICRKIGNKTWLYRCSNVTCEFDVHLTCVATIIPPVAQFSTASSRSIPPAAHPPNYPGIYVPPTPRPPPVAVGQPPNQFIVNQYPSNPLPYNNVSQRPPSYGPAAGPANVGLTGQLLGGAVNGMASGIAQATTQALIQGLTGGGGGGGGGGGVGGDMTQVDAMGGGGTVMIDGGSYYDSGQGGIDGGYGGGGDGSYY